MKKHAIIFALLIAFCGLLSETLVAQQQQIKSRNRNVNKSINTANDAFKNGRYFKAFGYYDRAYRRETVGTVRMHLLERMGESQRRLNNPVESVLHFDRVWESGNRTNEFMLSYADVLLKTANYEKAESLYETLYGQDTSNVFLRNRLESAKMGLAYNDSVDVIFRDQIRSQYKLSNPFSQYGMVIVDGKLVYSSAQRVKPAATDQRTGHGFSHLYQATLRRDSLLWENPVPLSFNIWGDVINDGVFSYDHINKIGYFQRCNEGNCGIYTTTFENNVWTVPQKFEINGVGAVNMVGHPAISPDGKRLIFITRAPEGQGGSDLWMTTKVDRPATTAARRRATTTTANPATSRRAASAASTQTTRQQAAPPPPTTARARAAAAAPIIRNQDWNVPVNLGNVVNSAGDEVFPVWVNDSAIAFSSNGHVGYGGLDIYVAIADSTGNFTERFHLEAPINSSFDDYTLVISPNINHIFFSSSRHVGFGRSDEIYSFPKTAAIMEFQFEVTDIETGMPLAETTISVRDTDTNFLVTTDSLGKAKLITQKTANVFDFTFEKQDFYTETRIVRSNPAFDIIPLRDKRQINVALLRDTSLKIEFDPIPEEEILEEILEELPAVIWFYSVNQVRGQNEAELVATAIIRQDAFMISNEQLSSELFSPMVFNFNPDPEKYELIGEVRTTTNPLTLSPEKDPLLAAPISVFIDSVTFIQRIHISSPTDFRVTGAMNYTLGFERLVDVVAEALNPNVPNNYTPFTGVPLSFPIFGVEPPQVPEPEKEDLSWADDVPLIENPVFTHKISLHGCDSIDLMTECMRPGMTPEQIIDCINRRRRECEGLVDTRFVNNYSDRINDPNRRANMSVLPPGTPCVDCGKNAQQHPSDEPLFIQASDDKQTLRFTDNAGNITFFDLAPNTRYQISIQNFISDNMAALPDHINASDIVKTVTTKDYVIFECLPKLSEIGDEIFVNNIYFDFDQSDIIKDGHRELDRLIIIAIKNPHMKFEIVSHADERGSVAHNLALTERRLNSVLDYIRRKGMDAGRLITRAAGNLEPLIRNAQTDEEHALNRRTTIRLFDPNAVNELAHGYELHENNPFDKKGLWFRVQIAAFREAPEYPLYLFSEYIKAAQGVELTFYQDRDGLYKFTLGEFQDLNQARRLNQRILDVELESYVVAFMDGQRITIAEAQAIMRRQARN